MWGTSFFFLLLSPLDVLWHWLIPAAACFACVSPIHSYNTADADETQLSSWVASAVSTHSSAVVTQFTISCAVQLLRLVTSDGIMTSLLKKLPISIKIHVVKPLWVCLVSFQIVDRIRRQSSWDSCEFCSHRRRDATRQSSRVGGVYWAMNCRLWMGLPSSYRLPTRMQKGPCSKPGGISSIDEFLNIYHMCISYKFIPCYNLSMRLQWWATN